MSGHAAAHLDELARIPASGEGEASWTPIRHALGIGGFGVNAWHGDQAGDVVIEEHDEIPADGDGGDEELYVVLSGQARFTVAGEEIVAGPGMLVSVPPHIRRGAVAIREGTTILAIGAPRGDAYQPDAWERRALHAAGLT